MPPIHSLPAASEMPSRRCRAGEQGFGLLEVALALLVIAVATLGSVSWTLSGMSLETENREQADAHDALRQLCEEINALPFDEVFARCNTIPDDDPDGVGTSHGARFQIKQVQADRLLDALYVVPDSASLQRQLPLEVSIQFPVNASGQLIESAQTPAWGDQVWDLNGDGEISDEPITGGYQILPVHIRIDWVGAGGPRHIEHVRLLSRRVRSQGSE